MDKRTVKFPINLFCSLMLLSFIPFLYTLVRTNLIADIPAADGLGIAGHMEWFDLINETVQAFLIVPLYALLNQCLRNREKLRERVFQSFLAVTVNAACILLCMAVVYREKLMAVSFRFSRRFVQEYLFMGFFGGAQILLDNIIYFAIVCKMVNEVAEQGNYWTANNIIWGLMLIPILALAEIIKKDCKEELEPAMMKHYHIVIIVTFLAWLFMVPWLDPFLKNIMGIKDFQAIRHILMVLMPFYLAYNYTALFDNILIGHGKTQYCFAISVIVNLVYYPIVYGLMQKGVFVPSITFICMMFGFGMVVHLACSVVCYAIYKRRMAGKKCRIVK